MANYVQTNRPLKVATTLGGDKFLLASVRGREAVSTPYEFRLELRSEDGAVDGKALLRTPVAVSIETDEDTPRYIHGVIRRFMQHGRRDDLFGYQVDVVPWFWLLSLSRDCRIFQNLNALEIVQQVFKDLGFKPTEHFRLACTKTPPKRDYCVQYRETHMDFVSRLLEEEGIFYFFEHTADKHVMVLADGNNAVPVCPGAPKARMGQEELAVKLDVVSSLSREHIAHTGKVTLKDYDYLQPALTLEGSISGDSVEEVYDYPGGFTTIDGGDRFARLQLEAEEAIQQTVRGESSCRGFQAGTTFDLENHFRSDVDGTYMLLEVELESQAENFLGWEQGSPFKYHNRFLAIPGQTPFRPRRRTPRPLVAGTQTALVVGPPGEEVWVDKHGRVKVQFYWDRVGNKDDKSSCWVRVSTMWAGKAWGSVSIPRIGNEVVVDFLEGDPDRPLIVGSVYNADQTPPFTLPGAGIQMGMKTRSSKGGGGMNEISMTDTKSKELINIHAQYDMTTTVEHDMKDVVHHDRTITVDGTHTETISKDTKVSVTGGTLTETVSGDITIKSGAAIKVTAASSIKLVTGASSIEMDAGGTITIKGVQVTVEGTATVEAKANAMAKIDAPGSELTLIPGMATLHSAVVQSNADGMNTMSAGGPAIVKGAIVQVN
jgi:type VI secretion system secreted protein VgrG